MNETRAQEYSALKEFPGSEGQAHKSCPHVGSVMKESRMVLWEPGLSVFLFKPLIMS